MPALDRSAVLAEELEVTLQGLLALNVALSNREIDLEADFSSSLEIPEPRPKLSATRRESEHPHGSSPRTNRPAMRARPIEE